MVEEDGGGGAVVVAVVVVVVCLLQRGEKREKKRLFEFLVMMRLLNIVHCDSSFFREQFLRAIFR